MNNDVNLRWMYRRTTFRWKSAALQARALALGLLAAVLLVTAYTFVCGWKTAHAAHVSGAELLVPLQAQVWLAAWFSAIYGAILILICAPIWMLLTNRGHANGFLAIALGFFAPVVLWIAIDQNGYSTFSDLFLSGLPYGACGSAAGLVTWWCRPRRVSGGMIEPIST